MSPHPQSNNRPYAPNLAPWPEKWGGKLPLTEAFVSIQGEGRHAGAPALFLRFKYCNLGCAWCDTRFTWDADDIEPGELITIDELATLSVSRVRDQGSRAEEIHVVLTGGEPMLHQDRLPDLIDALQGAGFSYFEIETNGMFVPSKEMTERISWWNCSPKLTNNGLGTEVNVVPEAIRAIGATGKADFKFVIRDESDIAEMLDTYGELVARDRIMLMPEGFTRARQLRTMPDVINLCSKYGFRFSPRLHILAWGNERGR